jgi:hypothetical protein
LLPRLFTVLAVGASVALAGLPQAAPPAAERPIPGNVPSGANLFVVPMEWNFDELLRAEVRRSGLPVHLVARQEEADFIMTASSVKLGSKMLSPGRDFEVQIVAAGSGNQVWSAEASDYATFFGRLRHHGAARAAKLIVRKLRSRFFKLIP